MVRVAFCGISHETNTFATAALGLTTHFGVRVGEKVVHTENDGPTYSKPNPPAASHACTAMHLALPRCLCASGSQLRTR